MLTDAADLGERTMFGGHGFMVGGHLAVSVSGDGSLLVRVGTDQREATLTDTVAEPAVMGSRTMQGWVRVDAGRLAADATLARWVGVGVSQARSQPPTSS